MRVHLLTEDARGGDWAKNAGGRFKAIRCGRRWGKSKYDVTRATNAALRGKAIGIFAPDYKKTTEMYEDCKAILDPVALRASKTEGTIRTTKGGRIEFWTLDNESAGRSRFYHGVIIDEGAFTKTPNMLAIWEKAIKPTLLDYQGWALVTSNTNGVDPENFMYAICNDPKYGFIEGHAPSIANPLIPMRLPGESEAEHWARRVATFDEIKAAEHPLVYKQEYLAEFVDWSGVAFFELDKLLDQGLPVARPARCDSVYAVIDSATKTGSGNDGTAVTYWARARHGTYQLVLLDWDIVQIEGALLETWLPVVLQNLEVLALSCGARGGSLGAFIEDKASGEILLQQARLRGLTAHAIDSRLTALGKDERGISVSGIFYRGEVKICREAHDKVATYKGSTRNHLISQVTGFRVGDPDGYKRADDLLDSFVYGISLALGNKDGF